MNVLYQALLGKALSAAIEAASAHSAPKGSEVRATKIFQLRAFGRRLDIDLVGRFADDPK